MSVKHKSKQVTEQVSVIDQPVIDFEIDDIEYDLETDSDDSDMEEEACALTSGNFKLRPSEFNGLPSTVFIDYPKELGITRLDENLIEHLGNRKLRYNSYWERICIKNAFRRAGFEKSDRYWTVLWSKHQNQSQIEGLNCLQKINHFPSSWCIGRKDRLSRTLTTMKRIHGSQFDFHPETFILPQDRDSLHRTLKIESSSSSGRKSAKGSSRKSSSVIDTSSLWIVKPCASSCGKGIKVVTSQQLLVIPSKKKLLVQRYLKDPYLIDGKKFDLRIYVLVTGVDPLRVYIHDEGLTRISTSKYSLKNIHNRYAHLTNYSINKKSELFKAAKFEDESISTPATSTSASPVPMLMGSETMVGVDQDLNQGSLLPKNSDQDGFKWSLNAFRKWLAAKEGEKVMRETFDRINDLCLKTMIAAESEITPQIHKSLQYRTNCFELFGCDVILDRNLNPHLLEVNVSPSLMGSSPLDKKIKGTLISDVLHVVGIYPYDSNLLAKYNHGPNKSANQQDNLGQTMSSSAKYKTALTQPSGTSSKASSKGSNFRTDSSNPFAFSSLSKLMSSQELYRKKPSPETIDIAALGSAESSWTMLLMIEDELTRAKSTRFHTVHPTAQKAGHYTQLYRNCRFSDHLLAKWVISGGSRGQLKKHMPPRYFKPQEKMKEKQNEKKDLDSRSEFHTPTRPKSQHRSRTLSPRRSKKSQYDADRRLVNRQGLRFESYSEKKRSARESSDLPSQAITRPLSAHSLSTQGHYIIQTDAQGHLEAPLQQVKDDYLSEPNQGSYLEDYSKIRDALFHVHKRPPRPRSRSRLAGQVPDDSTGRLSSQKVPYGTRFKNMISIMQRENCRNESLDDEFAKQIVLKKNKYEINRLIYQQQQQQQSWIASTQKKALEIPLASNDDA